MCVAVVVETKKGPTPWELMQMEEDNPHGGGIAWSVGDLVRYRKGLTWKQIRAALPNLPRPVLLHFRWATHGGRARYLSHPFPLGSRAITSRKLNSAAKSVLIHNGVWSEYAAFAPNDLDLDKWSDTAVAAYVAGTWGEEILDHVDWATAVGHAAGGGRMDVTLRGRWYEHEGNRYSNLTWQYPSRVSIRDYLSSRGYYSSRDEAYRAPTYSYPATYPTQPSITAYPREPRWRPDGKLLDAGEVVDISDALLPTMDLLPDIAPNQPIDTWMDEFAEVQRALTLEDIQRRGDK